MVDNELLLLAAALVLVFALPLGLLVWMAAQYAQMRLLANRLEGLEVSVSRMRERGTAGAAGTAQDDATTSASASIDPLESPEPTGPEEPPEVVAHGEAGLVEHVSMSADPNDTGAAADGDELGSAPDDGDVDPLSDSDDPGVLAADDGELSPSADEGRAP